MTTGNKLIRVAEFKEIMAIGHQVEGTNLYVLELLMFGFAYSSYYILLRSKSVLTKLTDEKIRQELMERPYRFGKKLDFGSGLHLDPETRVIYYVGRVE